MGNLVWDPSYSVGVEILDHQHKNIISMINALSSKSDARVYSETISELLTRLVQYASEHFKTEERLLEKYGYPDLVAHKEKHKAYRLKAVEFCSKTMAHDQSVPLELKTFLEKWWENHILEVDAEYSHFLKNKK